MKYELKPRYDSRKSFYKKAHVIEADGVKTLQSYSTHVAYIKDGQAYVHGKYSNTTLRHIKDFLQQNGFEASSWKQISKDYDSDRDQSPAQEPESALGAQQKSVSLVCAIGQILCPDQKAKNDWDKRMINTLPGISFPDNWDQLSEEEKQRRLEGAKKEIS